jgi:hypothetical protein
MSLSLICTCGARLEIDDKFAGKVVTCPDCQRPLETTPPSAKAARTSGFALAGLALGIIGAFTLIGPILAIVCGVIGLRHIARSPTEVGGRRFALAAIILGGVFLLLGVGGHLSPEILGIDGLFREIEWAKKLNYSSEAQETAQESPNNQYKFTIERPNGSWAVLSHTGVPVAAASEDESVKTALVLVQPWDEAFISCATLPSWDPKESAEDMLERAVAAFLKSEVILVQGQFPATKSPRLTPTVRGSKVRPSPKSVVDQETLIDVNLGGYPRTFLLRVLKVQGQFKIHMVAAGTRSSRFSRLEPELRGAIDSFRVEEQP